jgi:histidine ammonia-lyase
MGANAAVKCVQIIDNLEKILAIELLTAAQALEFRKVKDSSKTIQNLHADFRQLVPFIAEDIIMHEAMNLAINFIQEYELKS